MAPATTARPVAVRLDVTRPFDGSSLLEFLRRRAVPGIELVAANTYSRTLRLPHGPASMQVHLSPGPPEVRFWLSDPADLLAGVQRCRWLLDLDADSATIDSHLSKSPHLASSVQANPGLRVPGHVDGFEVAVRAVVGQQISVAGARTILGRLVEDYGDRLQTEAGLSRLFPTPQSLAAADPMSLPMPRSRGRALVAVSASVVRHTVVLDRTAERADVRRALLAQPGVGPWTADYIALRALGDPDIFMGTDLGVRHGLARMGLSDGTAQVVQGWAPWRSYALMHVWKRLDKESS